MASTSTRLGSFFALITLFAISPAGAFSGRFEVSDLCVDSPFQADVTSTANSTVSCMFYPPSFHAVIFSLSWIFCKPKSSSSDTFRRSLQYRLTTLANNISFQSSSSMRTLRKLQLRHVALLGRWAYLHQPSLS
jgi:hypothetical protein